MFSDRNRMKQEISNRQLKKKNPKFGNQKHNSKSQIKEKSQEKINDILN